MRIVGKLGASSSGGAASDFDYVTGADTDARQVRRRQSSNGVADILDTRFGNTQREACPGRRGDRFQRSGIGGVLQASVIARVSQSVDPQLDILLFSPGQKHHFLSTIFM